jgi:ferritin-like metal-binding protein YciE
MSANSLQDLYVEKLQDLLSAEQQILEALPQMIQKTSHPQLRQGFEAHLRQTQEQANRVQRLLQQHGAGEGKKCEGMAGIIREGQMTMKEVNDPNALDALLIAAAQSVEHYEIAGYGTARTWARQIGREQDAQILQQTLDEEEQTDKLLTQVAESFVNRDAMQGDRQVSMSAQREGTAAAQGGLGAARRGRAATSRRTADARAVARGGAPRGPTSGRRGASRAGRERAAGVSRVRAMRARHRSVARARCCVRRAPRRHFCTRAASRPGRRGARAGLPPDIRERWRRAATERAHEWPTHAPSSERSCSTPTAG